MPETDLKIRPAKEEDSALLLEFIRALAEFEKMGDQVEATEATMRETLFSENRRAAVEGIIGEWRGEPASFAIYFHNYSTFTGRAGLYLEDLFVKPEYRRHGIGRQMLAHLANIAVERNCPRFEWVALDWNRNAIDFYEKLGAKKMHEWQIFRISGDKLEELAHASY